MMAYDGESLIATAIERLNDKMDRIDAKVDTVQSDVNKFVVLFEKLAHIEKVHEENNKRVHHRIDDIEKRLEKTEHRQMETGCPSFQKFRSEHDNELKHNLEKIKSCEDFKKTVYDKFAEFKKYFDDKINDLNMKPAKRWESVTTTIITVGVTSIVVYIMAKMGFGK